MTVRELKNPNRHAEEASYLPRCDTTLNAPRSRRMPQDVGMEPRKPCPFLGVTPSRLNIALDMHTVVVNHILAVPGIYIVPTS